MPVTATRPRRYLDDPDVRLMLRVRRDEPGAFDELVQAVGPRLFAHFVRALRDRQEAEDLMQEVFLRLYRGRKRYRPTARFATWLYHIRQNVVRNAIRRRRRHAWLRYGPPGPEVEVSAAEATDPAERSEKAAVVRAAVAGLLDRQRRAVELHQFQHRSYAEVAADLALSPEATKSLLYRARVQLRGALKRLND